MSIASIAAPFAVPPFASDIRDISFSFFLFILRDRRARIFWGFCRRRNTFDHFLQSLRRARTELRVCRRALKVPATIAMCDENDEESLKPTSLEPARKYLLDARVLHRRTRVCSARSVWCLSVHLPDSSPCTATQTLNAAKIPPFIEYTRRVRYSIRPPFRPLPHSLALFLPRVSTVDIR